jgi:hypothetical protein
MAYMTYSLIAAKNSGAEGSGEAEISSRKPRITLERFEPGRGRCRLNCPVVTSRVLIELKGGG